MLKIALASNSYALDIMPPSEKEIKQWMRKIDSSTFSVDAFFSAHDVPFSRAQYFRYKKLLNENYEFKQQFWMKIV